MIKNREAYEAPTTNVLVIRIEAPILTLSSSGNTIDNATIEEWDGLL